jgi:hypothetical protein
MRLKSLLLATAALSMFSAPPSRADQHYVSLFGGMSFPETARAHLYGSTAYEVFRDTGFVVGGTFGAHFWNNRWRGEIETAYSTSDVSDVLDRWEDVTREAFGELAHLTFMANLWRDFAVPASIGPMTANAKSLGPSIHRSLPLRHKPVLAFASARAIG